MQPHDNLGENSTTPHINIMTSCRPRKTLRHPFGNNLNISRGRRTTVLHTRNLGTESAKSRERRTSQHQFANSTGTRLFAMISPQVVVQASMIQRDLGQIGGLAVMLRGERSRVEASAVPARCIGAL